MSKSSREVVTPMPPIILCASAGVRLPRASACLKRLRMTGHAPLGGGAVGVAHDDTDATRRAPLGDARAHDAGAHDADDLEFFGVPVAGSVGNQASSESFLPLSRRLNTWMRFFATSPAATAPKKLASRSKAAATDRAAPCSTVSNIASGAG